MKKSINIFFILIITLLFYSCHLLDKEKNSNNFIKGYIQKGPFIQGSTIIIQELDGSLVPTGDVFYISTKDDYGSFDLADGIESRYVEIIANGYYYNEISDELSPSTLSLYCIADIDYEKEINVNILTTLEHDRIKYLMRENNLTFQDARIQAENEVLNIFNIQYDESIVFADLNIAKIGDINGILLAVSIVLQGDNSVAQLSELLAKISQDIETDGILDNENYYAQIKNNSHTYDLEMIRLNLEEKYIGLANSTGIPYFEEYVDMIIPKNINIVNPVMGEHIDTTPLITWNDSGGVPDTYYLEIAKDYKFTDIIVSAEIQNSLSYQVTTFLENNTTYYLWVYKKDSSDNIAESSAVRKFSIKIPVPAIIYPVNEMEYNEKITSFDWDMNEDGLVFQFQLNDNSNLSGNCYIIENQLNETEYTAALPIPIDKTIYWRVRAVNEDGVPGDWSILSNFKIRREIWRAKVQTDNGMPEHPAIDSSGNIYTAAYYGGVSVITPEGLNSWYYDLFLYGNDNSTVVSENDIIYTKGLDNDGNYIIYAINSAGQIEWQYGNNTIPGIIKSNPAIGPDGVVYFSLGGRLIAVDKNGVELWNVENSDVHSIVIDTSGRIYCTGNGHLASYTPSGEKLWEIDLVAWAYLSDFLAIGSDNTIYLSTERLHAITPDRTIKWVYDGLQILSEGIIGENENIYIVARSNDEFRNFLLALNPDGTEIWRYEFNSMGYDIVPAIGNDGSIFFTSGTGRKLYCINSSGQLNWTYGITSVSCPVITDDGTLYIIDEYNYLVALRTNCNGLADTAWPRYQHDNRNSGFADGN